jgi:hypothetical protein
MILYTNGDSFVAGCGLVDYQFPGYPGDYGLSDANNINFSENIRWKNQIFSAPGVNAASLVAQVSKLERKKAFPFKLKQLLGCELIDSSEGGSSFDKITRKTLVDLINIRKHTSNRIVAIIGDTALHRRDQPYTINGIPSWFQLQPNIQYPPIMEDIYNQSILVEHDYHSFFYYYKNCILLKEFCINNNIELHWLNAISPGCFVGYPDLQVLKEHADIKYTVDMVVESHKVANCFVCDGHFSEPVHDLVAESFNKVLQG